MASEDCHEGTLISYLRASADASMAHKKRPDKMPSLSKELNQ